MAIGHRRHAPQPYARAAAACGASARGVWDPASYSTWVGSGRLRVSCLRAGGQAGERGRRAGQCGRAERAPGRRDWQHHRY
eukprot:scaffold11037_cov124-Isochrysis_galbana.AAC.4